MTEAGAAGGVYAGSRVAGGAVFSMTGGVEVDVEISRLDAGDHCAAAWTRSPAGRNIRPLMSAPIHPELRRDAVAITRFRRPDTTTGFRAADARRGVLQVRPAFAQQALSAFHKFGFQLVIVATAHRVPAGV